MSAHDYAKIDILLEGVAMTTDIGHPAFCAVVLVETAAADGTATRVLVDPAHVGRRPFLWDALARRGLGPTDIDMVVLTHAHWDHVQNVDVFGHAPILMHADEYTYSLNPHVNDWATPAWTGRIFDGMDLRSVREGDEILPGIGVVEMPGHSPGSIGVTVETEDGLAVITGDALHFAGVALTKRNPLVFWDPEEAAQSIERVVAMADVLYPGHDQPFSVTKDGEIDYRHRPTMTFVGVEPGTDGLDFQGGPVIAEPWVMPGIEQQRSLFAAFRAADEAGRDALELGGERPAHQHRPDVDRRGHAAGHRHAH